MTDQNLERDGDPGPDLRLEGRVRTALAVLADDGPAPRPPDLPRFAAVRRRRRTGLATAVLAVAVAAPVGWSASGWSAPGRSAPGRTPPARSAGPDGVQVAGPVTVAGVVTVTCSPGRTEVDVDHVQVSADGVHLRVLNRTGGPTVVSSRPAQGIDGPLAGVGTGNTAVTGSQEDLVVPVPAPGLQVSCDGPGGERPTDPAVVRLDDPHRLYRRVDVERVLGCTLTGIADGVGSTGATVREAAERAAAGVTGEVRLLPGPGYPEATDSAVYLGRGDRNRVVITVAKDADGRYVAYAEYFCTPGSWKD
jgi:hypothetical protein